MLGRGTLVIDLLVQQLWSMFLQLVSTCCFIWKLRSSRVLWNGLHVQGGQLFVKRSCCSAMFPICFKSVGWCGRDRENLHECLCSSHWQLQDCKIRIARNICLMCAFSKEPFFAWHSWQKQIFNMQFAVSAKLYCMILKISNDVDRCRWLQNGCPIFKQLSLIITWYHSYAPDQGSTHCHSNRSVDSPPCRGSES